MGRIVHGLLWLCGACVVVLMGYTVSLEIGEGTRGDRPPPPPASFDVAVVYPGPSLWDEFQRGVDLCVRRGVVQVASDGGPGLVVKTRNHGRSIRFRHHDARGLRETKEAVDKFVDANVPPIALVGSSNTVLTEAIAVALAANVAPTPGKAPVLLVPWASAVFAAHSDPGEAPLPLLKIAAGRTFRFCLNNQYQAEMLVEAVRNQEPDVLPRRAVVVVDRDDPFSVDLAASFSRALAGIAPRAEIVERSVSPSASWPRTVATLPDLAEDALAASVIKEARALPGGEPTWVFLPLQDEPSARFLLALQRHSTIGDPIRVICGDAVGTDTLAEFAGRASFPVFCVSSTAAAGPGSGESLDALIPAEIVGALAACLDVPDGASFDAESLREALADLTLPADSPSALGRSLAFKPSGERVGDDLGHVLMIRPGRSEVYSTARATGGQWSAPLPIAAEPKP